MNATQSVVTEPGTAPTAPRCEVGRHRAHNCSQPLACLREEVAALNRAGDLQAAVTRAQDADRTDRRIRNAGGLLALGVWPEPEPNT